MKTIEFLYGAFLAALAATGGITAISLCIWIIVGVWKDILN